MTQNDTSTTDSSSVYVPFRLAPASTYQARYIQITTSATTAETNFILQDMFDEAEWNETFNTPHVQSGLRHLATEARRQFAAKETEEGGFAVE